MPALCNPLARLILILASFPFETSQAFLEKRDNDEQYSIPRERNPDLVRDGFRARQRIFAKLDWDVPPRDVVPHDQDFPFNPNASMMNAPVYFKKELVLSPLAKANVQIGSAKAVPEPYYAEYLTPISIGTPPQLLNMDIDTGSSDFWVFSSLQSKNQTQGRDGIFQPRLSSTFRILVGATWRILYGDGSSANGIVGTDRVEVGGAVVEKQAVELARNVSQGFVDDKNNDGLVGMGFSNINNVRPNRQKTLFDNLKPTLPKPLFTANLLEDGSGTFDFGYINASNIPAGRRLSYLPINPNNGFWQFPSTAFAINGKRTRRADIASVGGPSAPAIADTGTSLLVVDSIVAYKYYQEVEGSGYSSYYGGYIFPCGATLPSFGIALGEENYFLTVPGKIINYAQVDAKYCYGAIQGNGGYGLQVLGDTLFRSAFVVFDGTIGAPRLGFVVKDVR